MSYESYRARLNVYGGNIQNSTKKASKQSQKKMILNSPIRKFVKINDSEELYPCLPSDVDTFLIREFLFLPEFVMNRGDFIHYDNYTYLITEHNTSDITPVANAELCNDIFTLTFEGTKIIVGYNDFGQPIYDYTNPITYNVPCVLSTKIYSTVDNSPIPLPDGSIMIKMPYKIGQIPPINYIFTYHNDPYKVATIDYDNVINGIGFIEMRLQRFTGGES